MTIDIYWWAELDFGQEPVFLEGSILLLFQFANETETAEYQGLRLVTGVSASKRAIYFQEEVCYYNLGKLDP